MQHDGAGLAVGTGHERQLRGNDGVKEITLGIWMDLVSWLTRELRQQLVSFTCHSEDQLGLELIGAHIIIQQLRIDADRGTRGPLFRHALQPRLLVALRGLRADALQRFVAPPLMMHHAQHRARGVGDEAVLLGGYGEKKVVIGVGVFSHRLVAGPTGEQMIILAGHDHQRVGGGIQVEAGIGVQQFGIDGDPRVRRHLFPGCLQRRRFGE